MLGGADKFPQSPQADGMPGMTGQIPAAMPGLVPNSSWPGSTRPSIFFVKTYCEE
jgi:hypothetical protein